MAKTLFDTKIDIVDLEFPNKGVGYFGEENKKVTVKNTIPGQTVIADVKKKRKNFYYDNGMPKLWQCIGATIQSYGRQKTRTSTGCRCQTSHLMMPIYVLFEYGKIGNESSRRLAEPHGAFGYIGHNECVHAYRIR